MARHHEHDKRGDRQHDHATEAETHAPPTTEKRAADEMAADAAVRRMAGSVEGEDDGMVLDDANSQRIELLQRADRYVGAVRRSVDKFQSILRHRHAESAIEKKIGWKLAGEKFKERAIDFLKDKLSDSVKEIAKASEIAPGLGQVVTAVGEVKGVVDDNAKAQQAEAEVESVDDIVIGLENVCDEAKTTANEHIGGASPEELARWLAVPEKLPNEAMIIQQLDSMLLAAMRDSGSQSVNESLDALKERGKLGEEIENRNAKWKGGGK